jgi:hypothetical protein
MKRPHRILAIRAPPLVPILHDQRKIGSGKNLGKRTRQKNVAGPRQTKGPISCLGFRPGIPLLGNLSKIRFRVDGDQLEDWPRRDMNEKAPKKAVYLFRGFSMASSGNPHLLVYHPEG